MIKLGQLTEALKNCKEDGIFGVEVSSDRHTCGQLIDKIDSGRPYSFVVDQIDDDQILRICVFPIAKIQRSSNRFHDLARINHWLECGCVGSDDDGNVSFQLSRACAGNYGELSPEFLKRLLLDGIEAV